MVSKALRGHLACFIAYAIFGINIVVCKDLTSSNLISPIGLYTIRAVCAACIFWLLSLFTPREQVEKKDFLKLLAAAVCGFLIPQLSFLMAIPITTPMGCSIITATQPIYTMFIAAWALKEPITFKKAGGVALSFAGIMFLIFSSMRGAVSGEMQPAGIVLMLINSIVFALYLGLFKPLIRKYSVITYLKWIFLFATIMTLPFSAREVFSVDYAAIPAEFIFELGFLIIFATVISYFLIPIGQRNIRPTLVSMYSYFQPLIATGLSIILGIESLGWEKIAAAVMVFAGVVIVSRSKSASAS